jgi:molybdopterin/thiamine biosynthesis adenylyltransferase
VTLATAADPDRYARQRLIPGWDQQRLAASTAVVVGVGAVGNEVAKNLALAGVGRLILCDPDVAAASNLSRTVLLRPGDVGRPKAEAAAAALAALVPGVVAEPRVTDLGSGVGLGELADAGVTLSCVDTIRARMRLLGRCVLAGSALVDGGTHPFGGEIRVRLAPDEPCYACSLSSHDRGVADLPWSCFGLSEDGPQPAAITTAALIASWMSVAALHVLLGTPPPYRVLAIDAVTGRTAPVLLSRDPDCPHHRPLDGPVTDVPASSQATTGEFLALLRPQDEAFTWEQFPVGGRCARCQHARPAPAAGDAGASGDRVAACPRCGGLVRMRFSQRLRDAAERSRLCDLGVAPEEILPVRDPGGEYTCRRLRR